MKTTKKKYELKQSQKMMVFVLSMSLYGLATLFTELVPKINLGIIEFSIEYLAFIPLTLAILLDPLSAALGAATGEVIFSEIMLGQFGGLGEVEKFVLFSLGIYIAGMLVNDPLNKKQVAIASITGIAIHQVLAAGVDIAKVLFAVEAFEAVPGLPESVVIVEGWSALNDILFSGILFCMLPTMFLVPRLYGKIEPLLGLKKRTAAYRPQFGEVITPKFVVLGLLIFVCATGSELLAELGIRLIDFEASWAESPASMVISAAVLILILATLFLVVRYRKNQKMKVEENEA